MQWKAIATAVMMLGACSNATAAKPEPPATRPSPEQQPAKPRWQFALSREPGPVSADDHGSIVLAHDVVAIDHDGKEQWRRPLDDLGIQYPAIDDHLVVVSTVVDAAGGTSGAFVALDRATGDERWRVNVDGEPGAVTLTDHAVFAATANGNVFAFARGGAPLWHVDLPVTISSRGSIAYDPETEAIGITVFEPGRGWVLGLFDARTGTDVGGLELGRGDPPSAVVAAGVGRFVVGDGSSHHVLVVDLEARVVAAAVATTAGFDPASVPAVDGDLAIAVDAVGTVTAVDLRAGRARWQRRLDRPALDARPQLTHEAVVVAGFATPLSVLSRADGRALESPERRRGVPASYATAGDLLVVAVRFGAPSAVEGWTVS